MAEEKKKSIVDRVLHPGKHESESSDETGKKPPPPQEKQKPQSRPGRANPTEDYNSHPKFAKFRKASK